jgi:hypothetical protein
VRRVSQRVRSQASPGEARFEAAYADATLGRAKVGSKPAAVVPRTLRAVWLEVQRTADWKILDFATRQNQISIAERFFALPIADGNKLLFGAMPVAGLRRGDIKKILGRYTDRPHAGDMVLRLIRKLTVTALDLEWIESDPTYKLKYRPKLKGHRAWTDAELQAYEAKWQPGTVEYLGYALALYTGQRRGDLAAMRWSAFDGAGIAVVQQKTDAPLWIRCIRTWLKSSPSRRARQTPSWRQPTACPTRGSASATRWPRRSTAPAYPPSAGCMACGNRPAGASPRPGQPRARSWPCWATNRCQRPSTTPARPSSAGSPSRAWISGCGRG